MSVPPQPLSSASRNHALPFDQQQLAAAQIKIAANVAASALRPRGKSSAEGAGSHRLSFVAAPHQLMTMPPQVADDGELSEIEWINMLNPKISTRNGGYPFYAGVAFKEFLIHLMLPLSLPAIYTWIWAREGKAFADIWSQNHNFAMPPLTRPLFTRNNIQMNMMSFAGYFFFTIFINIVAILPMIVAFLRVYDLPINGAATVSQDYTHEAYFVFVLRAAWCAVVGIKYGFYSDPLLNYVQKNHLSIALLSSEQIMNNWYPDLGRLMFELDVVTARMPLFRNFCLSVSKKHPVVKYLQRCLQVGDQPLCLLKQKSISKILQKLPENNFHKLFWTKTPSMIQRPGFVDATAATMEIISYSKYVQGVDLSAKDFKTECAGDSEQSAGSLPSNAASQPLNTHAHLDPSLVVNSVALVNGLSVENTELSGSKPEPKSDACSSKFVDVPAFILLAYCISLANNMGSAWIGPSVGECRLSYVIYFITAGFYAIAGSLRVSQVHTKAQLYLLRSFISTDFACRSQRFLSLQFVIHQDLLDLARIFVAPISARSIRNTLASSGATSRYTFVGFLEYFFGCPSSVGSCAAIYLSSCAVQNWSRCPPPPQPPPPPRPPKVFPLFHHQFVFCFVVQFRHDFSRMRTSDMG
jgi:hypothetical protein